jgi:membrane protease YdiL (CAAX protease family)
MNSNSHHPSGNRTLEISLWALIPFLIISFGLAWGILGLYVFWGGYMSSVFGLLTGNHPLFFIAVYSPAIAAFAIVAQKGGLYGIRCFLGRALLWRCSGAWYAFLLLGVPLIFTLGSVCRGNFLTDPLPFSTFAGGIVALTLAAIKGPMEEFGWRGLALPLLQRKLVPFWAGLSLGIVWGLWHLPAFLLSGTQQSEWSFGAFFSGCLAISIIATALFNRSGGSILLSAFFHFTLMNPIFPDAQHYDTYQLIAAASLVVWWNRKSMFTKLDTVVEVIPNKYTNR